MFKLIACEASKENEETNVKSKPDTEELDKAKWIVPKKVDTKNKKSTLICTPLPSQMVKAYC